MNRSLVLHIARFALLGWLVPATAMADWINFSGAENAPNIAEIYIHSDHVRIELEIYVNDMVVFDQILPDAFFKGSSIQRPPQAERMQQFSRTGFQVQTEAGRNLAATLRLVEPRFRKKRASPYAGKPNPFTGQRIPGPPQDKRVLYVELVYPFKEKPTTLTFIPPLDNKSGFSKVPLGFVTYHDRVLVNDFRFLPDAATLHLDWDDPRYSVFDKKALKRWQRGSVMSFLYIEDYEVRHEVLARVKDLAAWIDLGLRGPEFIEEDENDALKKRVGEFFLKRDKVLIDGQQLQPILDRTAFVKVARTGSRFLVQPERLPLNTAMIGVIITYPTKKMPREVTSEWTLWSDRIQKVPTNAIDPAGPFPSYVTPDSNILTWTNFLKKHKAPTVARLELDPAQTTLQLPLASILGLLCLVPLGVHIGRRRRAGRSVGLPVGVLVLVLAGSLGLYPFLKVAVAKPAVLAPEMTKDESVSVLKNLLDNVYRSFDFRQEEDVYDRLATSVHGDLLTEIYLQNRKSLVVSQAGGARARVKRVEIQDVDIKPHKSHPLGLVFAARWTALGTVGHWGHIHTRKNWYHANIIVEPVEGAWKITGLELLEEKRIDPNAPNELFGGQDEKSK